MAISFLPACTSGGGGGEDSASSVRFASDCGVVSEESLSNPPSSESGTAATLSQVVSSNTVIVSTASGDQLLRLAGVADAQSAFSEVRSQRFLESARGPVRVFYVNQECTVGTAGGGTATLAILFNETTGENLNEGVIVNGDAQAETGNICGAELIHSCYHALDAQHQILRGGTVSQFLWKPGADRDGLLVVLLNPHAGRVTANGEELTASGPSNGRQTTMRGTKPGCAYGANVRIEAFDDQGRPLVFPDAQLFYSIPNGCDRHEF